MWQPRCHTGGRLQVENKGDSDYPASRRGFGASRLSGRSEGADRGRPCIILPSAHPSWQIIISTLGLLDLGPTVSLRLWQEH